MIFRGFGGRSPVVGVSLVIALGAISFTPSAFAQDSIASARAFYDNQLGDMNYSGATAPQVASTSFSFPEEGASGNSSDTTTYGDISVTAVADSQKPADAQNSFFHESDASGGFTDYLRVVGSNPGDIATIRLSIIAVGSVSLTDLGLLGNAAHANFSVSNRKDGSVDWGLGGTSFDTYTDGLGQHTTQDAPFVFQANVGDIIAINGIASAWASFPGIQPGLGATTNWHAFSTYDFRYFVDTLTPDTSLVPSNAEGLVGSGVSYSSAAAPEPGSLAFLSSVLLCGIASVRRKLA